MSEYTNKMAQDGALDTVWKYIKKAPGAIWDFVVPENLFTTTGASKQHMEALRKAHKDRLREIDRKAEEDFKKERGIDLSALKGGENGETNWRELARGIGDGIDWGGVGGGIGGGIVGGVIGKNIADLLYPSRKKKDGENDDSVFDKVIRAAITMSLAGAGAYGGNKLLKKADGETGNSDGGGTKRIPATLRNVPLSLFLAGTDAAARKWVFKGNPGTVVQERILEHINPQADLLISRQGRKIFNDYAPGGKHKPGGPSYTNAQARKADRLATKFEKGERGTAIANIGNSAFRNDTMLGRFITKHPRFGKFLGSKWTRRVGDYNGRVLSAAPLVWGLIQDHNYDDTLDDYKEIEAQREADSRQRLAWPSELRDANR